MKNLKKFFIIIIMLTQTFVIYAKVNNAEKTIKNVFNTLQEVKLLCEQKKYKEAYDKYLSIGEGNYSHLKYADGTYVTTKSEKYKNAYENYDIYVVLFDDQPSFSDEYIKIPMKNRAKIGNVMNNCFTILSDVCNYFNSLKNEKENRIKAEQEAKNKEEARIKEENEAKIKEGKSLYTEVQKKYDLLNDFKYYFKILPKDSDDRIKEISLIINNKDYLNIKDCNNRINEYMNVIILNYVQDRFPNYYKLLEEENLISVLDNSFLNTLKNGMDFAKDDPFLLHQLWYSILSDFENSKYPFFDISFRVSEGTTDYNKGTTEYSLIIETTFNKFFYMLLEGLKKAYDIRWTDIPKEWGKTEFINNSYNISLENIMFSSTIDLREIVRNYFLNFLTDYETTMITMMKTNVRTIKGLTNIVINIPMDYDKEALVEAFAYGKIEPRIKEVMEELKKMDIDKDLYIYKVSLDNVNILGLESVKELQDLLNLSSIYSNNLNKELNDCIFAIIKNKIKNNTSLEFFEKLFNINREYPKVLTWLTSDNYLSNALNQPNVCVIKNNLPEESLYEINCTFDVNSTLKNITESINIPKYNKNAKKFENGRVLVSLGEFDRKDVKSLNNGEYNVKINELNVYEGKFDLSKKNYRSEINKIYLNI